MLGLLLYAGGMPLPLAGTAVLAMRAAASAIVNSMFQVSQLYESGFTLELHRTLIADARARSRPAGRAAPTGPAEIMLPGVSFRYPGHDERALVDVSLTLRRGEVIALVGENGSGKSTLAKLLTGLYLPDEGVVAWDGVDTASIGAPALHERIAVVLQDPLHWPMTAANNVRIGRLDRPDPGDVAFTDAAARSGADAVLAALPDGAETMLSRQFQKGRDLSGGQWQRLSVARGLYRDAPLVIADEPTAAMDARAEHAVFTALRGLGGSERITVLVTHRLANVRHADQIVVLEEGRVDRAGHARGADGPRRHLPRAVLAAGPRVRGHLSRSPRRGAGSTQESTMQGCPRWDAPPMPRPRAGRRCAGPCWPSRSSCVGGFAWRSGGWRPRR